MHPSQPSGNIQAEVEAKDWKQTNNAYLDTAASYYSHIHLYLPLVCYHSPPLSSSVVEMEAWERNFQSETG